MRNSRSILQRRGFTLIEAMLATVIVGTGILSMMQLLTACTKQNGSAVSMTAAMLLAQNIQETMAGLSFTDPAFGKTYFGPEPGQTLGSFDDIDDFDAQMFSPPINSVRVPVADMPNYAQVVSVWPVFPNGLSSNSDPTSPQIPQTTYTGSARVTVRVLHRKNAGANWVEAYRTSWIRVAN